MLLRRSISALVCFLMLLPSAIALRGQEQPECCLRQGTHHCDADSQDAASMDDDMDQDDPVVHATAVCEYQHAPALTSYRTDALPTSHSYAPVFTRAWYVPASRVVPQHAVVTVASARAPPALN